MTVTCKFDKSEKPSKETLERLAAALDAPIVCDEDCLELTDDQITRAKEQRAAQVYLAKKSC